MSFGKQNSNTLYILSNRVVCDKRLIVRNADFYHEDYCSYTNPHQIVHYRIWSGLQPLARWFTAPAAAGKRADTCGFYPLNSRFPLFPNPAQTRDRRPLRKGERQRILSTVGAHNVRPFLYLYAVSDFVLLHRRVHLRRRDITVSRNSLVGGCGRHLQATIINKLYRRVRRPRRTVSND